MSHSTTAWTRLTSPFNRVLGSSSTDNAARFLRGAGGTFVVQITSAGLLFASQAVFARLLGVESFGIFVLAYAWFSVLLIPCRQGFDVATVRYVAAYQSRGEWGRLKGYLGFSRSIVLAASVAVAGAMVLGAWLFRSRLGEEALWAFWFAAATLPLFAQAQIHEAAMRGLGFIVRPQIFRYIVHPLVLLAALPVAIVWLEFGAGGDVAMAIYLGATALSLVGLWIMLRRRLPAAVHGVGPVMVGREWLNASFAMMFLMSFGAILNQISVIVLGALDGNAAAGLYGAAVRISYVLQPLIASLNGAIAPMAADLHARGDRAELQRVTSLGVRVVMVIAVVAAAVVIVLGRWILGLMGEEFEAAYPLLVVLICGHLVFAAAGPAGILLNMTGHHVDSAKVLALGAAVNLVSCLVLIPIYGALGAAVAMALTLAVWSGAMAYVAAKRLGIASFITIPSRR